VEAVAVVPEAMLTLQFVKEEMAVLVVVMV
jgi:hypothetical protein